MAASFVVIDGRVAAILTANNCLDAASVYLERTLPRTRFALSKRVRVFPLDDASSFDAQVLRNRETGDIESFVQEVANV